MNTFTLVENLLIKSPEEIEEIFTMLYKKKAEMRREPEVYIYIDGESARHFWVVAGRKLETVYKEKIGTKYYFAPESRGLLISKNVPVYSGARITSPSALNIAFSIFTQNTSKALEDLSV